MRAGWAVMAVSLVLVGSAAGFAWLCLFDADIAFLAPRGAARWIVYPDSGIGGVRDTVELGATFSRRFRLEQPPSRASLRVRALRRCRIEVNGREAPFPRPGSWKRTSRLEIGALLRAGDNLVEVEVANDGGPPALWLEIDLPGSRLTTDGRWQASWAGAALRPAAVAGAVRGRLLDPAGRVERVASSWAAVWPWIAAFALLGVVLGRLPFPPFLRSHWTLVAFAVVALLWVALFVHNAPALRRVLGFDSAAHLDYVGFILEHRALPLADDGWQMYQPPLYYLGLAVLFLAGGWTPADFAGIVALRLFNLGLALANLGFVLASLRRLLGQRPSAVLSGFGFAAFLPACLYLFHYPTNELMVITTASATIYACIRIGGSSRASFGDYGLLGCAFGAAMLSKVSALLLAPALVGFLIYRIARAGRIARRRTVVATAVAAGTAVAVCGWYYARVWAHFGTPLMGNWDPATGFGWWQHPGYRTVGDYLRFGRSLVEPAFAGFHGVWDGFYSTLWGDGLYGGKNGLPYRPPWNYDLMNAGYWLALVPGTCLVVGAGTVLRRCVRRPDPLWALQLGVAFLALAGMTYMTLKVPSYAQCKAFYGLIALVPLSALVATGAETLGRRHAAARVAVSAGLVAWALTAFGSYWTDADGPEAVRAHARQAWNDRMPGSAARQLRELLAASPDDWESRLLLAELLRKEFDGSTVERRGLLEPDRARPELALRHGEIGWLLLAETRPEDAARSARRATALAPDVVELWLLLARAEWEAGRAEASLAALREALRVDPGDAGIHVSLGNSLSVLGRFGEAAWHCRTALRLEPGYALAEEVLARIETLRSRNPRDPTPY